MLVVSDGDLSPEPRLIARLFGAGYLLGTNSATLESGGDFLRRMLGLFLQRSNADVLIRIDPDTLLHRNFFMLPTGICVFGTLQRYGCRLSVQGGLVGFTREAAERIYNLPPTTWARMNKPSFNWGKFIPEIYKQCASTRRVGTDWIIAFSAREAKISLQEFSEVRCCWKVPPPCVRSFAATHPHKDRKE